MTRINGDLNVKGVIVGFEGGSTTYMVKQYTSTTSQTAGSEAALTAFTAMTFPSTPDGVKKFAVTVSLMMDQTADGWPFTRLRMGANGDVTDAIEYQAATALDSSAPQSTPCHIGRFHVVPDLGETLTVSVVQSASNWVVNAFAGDRSNVIIEQVS